MCGSSDPPTSFDAVTGVWTIYPYNHYGNLIETDIPAGAGLGPSKTLATITASYTEGGTSRTQNIRLNVYPDQAPTTATGCANAYIWRESNYPIGFIEITESTKSSEHSCVAAKMCDSFSMSQSPPTCND